MKKTLVNVGGAIYQHIETESETSEQWLERLFPDASPESVTVSELSFDEQPDVIAMRAKRNALLAECDWTVLSDAPLTTTQKTAWKAYRNELRDYPADWTAEKAWPVKP
jgi:hypothetical protein